MLLVVGDWRVVPERSRSLCLPEVLQAQGPGVHIRRAGLLRDGIAVSNQAAELRREHEAQAGTEQGIFLLVVLLHTVNLGLAALVPGGVQGDPEGTIDGVAVMTFDGVQRVLL
ncbi:hypothetical protein D3C77_329880 [compost metagenome]